MEKPNLVAAIAEAEKVAHYGKIECQHCLDERRKQRCIDEQEYYRKTMAEIIRRLVCDYCKHTFTVAVDGNAEFCAKCGALQPMNLEGGYSSHRVLPSPKQ